MLVSSAASKKARRQKWFVQSNICIHFTRVLQNIFGICHQACIGAKQVL